MIITHSPAETRAFGRHLAQLLQPGDVVLLQGDLGAGKSELTRGIAAGLQIDGPIASPSFTILNVYEEGTIPLYHFDWYRLRSAEELYELGMEEYLGGAGIAVVEWPGQCPEAVPEKALEITLQPVSETEREIACRSLGGFRSLPLEENRA